ncbi:MAG: hypothetical protein QM535_11110 [Limnohabitans sp.]|nr:hypothetical protein [Limnohabitans sp.]
MKNFWTLLVSLIILSSCNDGNLIEETFNFSNATVQKCTSSNILYKISDKEALILNTPDTNFQNKEQTQNIPVNGATSIVYKKFSSNTNTNEICATPSIPVIETWNVVGGTLQIISTKIMNPANTSIVGYNHKITFKNITFIAPNKQVVYDSYEFGSYRTDVIDLGFDYSSAATQKCSSNNLIFKYNNNNALLLDISNPTLFNHTLGTKAQVIDTNNKVIYRVYNGSLNSNFFCSAITPSTPSLTEEWIAQDGVAVTSGEIRVETVQSGSQYKHTIKLYNTTFKKGVLEYNPAPNAEYVFGDYLTN